MKAKSVRGHRDIAEVIRERIRANHWAPGSRIPSESQLAVEFACSRGTVNRALRDLETSGVVARRKRAGTHVCLNPGGRATLNIPLIRDSVEAAGGDYSFVLLEHARVQPPSAIRGRMRTAESAELLHLRMLHMSSLQPYAYEDRWINPDAVPEIEGANLSSISANEWLVRNVPLLSGDMFLTARGANASAAEALQVPEGTALFVIERITRAQEYAITFVSIAHAPGFQMHTKI